MVRPDSTKLVTIYRPELERSDENLSQQMNDDIYKGVLGGSPGAFGVVTSIKFLAIHDNDPAVSESRNVQLSIPLGNIEKGTSQIVKTMLKYTPTSKLEDGLDVFVSIFSLQLWRLQDFGVIVPELAYTGSQYSRNVEKQINEFVDACKSGGVWLVRDLPLGQRLKARPPSTVAHKGVRSEGLGVTELGREFNFPYRKRVQCMLDKLPEDKADEFAKEFGKLVSDVVRDRDLLLVVQMLLGGGKVQSNDVKKFTGIPYRNQAFLFVFDVFYRNAKAEVRAVTIQDRMQELLDRTGGFNNRLFWGSFGREDGETDMSRRLVQDWYYESPQAYRDMQDIKKRVDPSDMFTTEFTVQNPSRPWWRL